MEVLKFIAAGAILLLLAGTGFFVFQHREEIPVETSQDREEEPVSSREDEGTKSTGLPEADLPAEGKESISSQPQAPQQKVPESKSISVPQKKQLVFTHPIFKPEEIDFVTPLGESNGGYIEVLPLAGMTVNIKKEIAAQRPIEIYAPTDMELVAYAHYIMEPDPDPDWALEFRINEEVSLTLHHVRNASQKIVDAVDSTPKLNDSRTTFLWGPQKIQFAAGEVIGTTTGTPQARNWNIYLYDKAVQNQFVNRDRYEGIEMGQRLITAACIFNYYQEEETRELFYNLLGASGAGQTDNCGSSSKDAPGTLSGLWHLGKNGVDFGSYEGSYADPFSVYMTADKSITLYEINGKEYSISPQNSTYKDPAAITISHCYLLSDKWNSDTPKGYAYFRIESDTQMSMAYSPSGSCPAAFPETQAKTYYR